MGVLADMPPSDSARPSAPLLSVSLTPDHVKIPPVLVVLVPSAVKLLTFHLCAVSTRLSGLCALELVKLPSGTSRPLLNAWLMNLLMLLRDQATLTLSRRRMNSNVLLNPTDNL